MADRVASVPLTDEDFAVVVRTVNMRMQGTYASVLGGSPQAHDRSDRLGVGFRRVLELAFQDVGLRQSEEVRNGG